MKKEIWMYANCPAIKTTQDITLNKFSRVMELYTRAMSLGISILSH